MGTSSSSLRELQDNKYLQLFAGKEPITPNDPFWNQLLSFTFVPPHTCADCRLLEDSTRPMLDGLMNNNLQTKNVAALIQVFLLHSSELKASLICENKVFVWQTYNSLFILRCVLKYFIETLGEEGLLKHLYYSSSSQPDEENCSVEYERLLEVLINSLIEIVVDVSLQPVTYAIIVEAINTLLVLLSVQMFSTRPAYSSLIYKTVMQGKCRIHSILLIKTLLLHFIDQYECPHCVSGSAEAGLIYGIASTLWNFLTFSYARGNTSEEPCRKTVLANQSLLLLLSLVCHCTNDKSIENPYREALFSFCNSNEEANTISTDTVAAFKINYDQLFTTFCNNLKEDQSTLLAYLLIHQNINFKKYVLASVELEEFVVPLLKILYYAPVKNSHHIYMALIVLLILSEDEQFDKKVHDIKLKYLGWYTERNLSEVTLGGMIILILIRTIQYNMTRMHDKYLHTNCLAALANMSAYFYNLHPYVCQKFINLLENMSKRQTRIIAKLKSGEGLSTSNDDEADTSDLQQDLSVLEEVIRMILEILNSCLCSQLKNNVNLLYTMLYNRHIFAEFHLHPCFEDIMYNINKVITFFSEHLQAVEQKLSVIEVSKIITESALIWPKDRLKKFPELKFKYVEEGQPEDFFIPYLWSLVFHSSGIYWNSKNILIFNPHKSV